MILGNNFQFRFLPFNENPDFLTIEFLECPYWLRDSTISEGDGINSDLSGFERNFIIKKNMVLELEFDGLYLPGERDYARVLLHNKRQNPTSSLDLSSYFLRYRIDGKSEHNAIKLSILQKILRAMLEFHNDEKLRKILRNKKTLMEGEDVRF